MTNLKDIFGKFNLLLFIWKRIYNVPFHYYKTFRFSYNWLFIVHTFTSHLWFNRFTQNKVLLYAILLLLFEAFLSYCRWLYIPVFLGVCYNNCDELRLKSDVPFTMLHNSIAGLFIKYKNKWQCTVKKKYLFEIYTTCTYSSYYYV